MRKTLVALIACMMLCLPLMACGQQQATSQKESGQATDETKSTEQTQPAESKSDASTSKSNPIGTVPNTIAEDTDALIATYPQKFTQETYADASTGLSVTYNLFLPEGYDKSASYPMVVFIADSSCAKGNATQSLTQGLGALVWATDEWQAANPTIVCVPTYPETILDDHNGYSTTEYVELTKRLKRAARETIPSYMIPRSFKYVDTFPLNPSGKADRKALAALIAE